MRKPISETSMSDLVHTAMVFDEIRAIIEDLNESQSECHILEILGYTYSLWADGTALLEDVTDIDVVAKYLRDLNAGLIAEHGEMGGV